MIGALLDAIAELEAIPARRECPTCAFWQDGCHKWGAMPPEDVRAKGCEVWIEATEMPF